MKPTKYDLWLAGVSELSSTVKIKLNELYPDLEELYLLPEGSLKSIDFLTPNDIGVITGSRHHRDLESDYSLLEQVNARIVTWRCADYPYSVSTLSDAPFALFVKGTLPPPGKPSIAIVGSRTCSAYGRKQASAFASYLAGHGCSIISGMALGIDGIAQRAALKAGGYSLGILGCGVGVCYPERHRDLYDRLSASGGIISEYPLYEPPLRYHFPQRNRLISVLSDAVLVIEAREKSGSLITADFALEQGRDVYALPGPVDSSLSRGCHNLIAQGAGILRSPEQLLEDLELTYSPTTDASDNLEEKSAPVPPGLSEDEQRIYSLLSYHPVKLTQLEEQTNLPADELARLMMLLQLKGLVTELSRHHYIRE